MTTDRWQRIETLYHEMLARPVDERAAALSAACSGDIELQTDVQSLLDQPQSAAGFLATPALNVVAGLVSPQNAQRQIEPGTRLGPYEVTAPLDSGGMGDVCRARDTKLNRDVALKVLPAVFASDPERMARFQREAQLLAALNHPHIAAIYGLEESPAHRAIVMELVEGDTLGVHIEKGPLTVADALRMAKQIADAVEYAHDKGIIHRDLKPANIKVTPDGTVKTPFMQKPL